MMRPGWIGTTCHLVLVHVVSWSASPEVAHIEALKITAVILRRYDLRLQSPEKEWQCKMLFSLVPHRRRVYVKHR